MRAQSREARYHWMTQAVIPRPIAWILTENDDGGFNLAPFSYFNALCSAPPLVGVSMSNKPGGATIKDTLRNIRARGRFVVHIASAAQLPQLNESAATLEYGDSEMARLQIPTAPLGDSVKIADCPLAMLCEFHREIALDDEDNQKLVLGEIILLDAADFVLSGDGKGRKVIDAAKVNPLARLSAGNYARLGELLSLQRPA